MTKQKGIKRVKRVTCKDCCFLNWLPIIAPGECGEIFGCGNYNEEKRRYLEKRYENKNGCLCLALLHFTYKGHNYRPGFMELKEEENEEMWIYYDYDKEQDYDKSCHRPDWSTPHDRETGRGSKFGYQGSGGLKGSGKTR